MLKKAANVGNNSKLNVTSYSPAMTFFGSFLDVLTYYKIPFKVLDEKGLSRTQT